MGEYQNHLIEGGVTAAKGFSASAIACGLKKNGQTDFALLVSATPARAAGVYTTNKVKAAPLLLTRERVAGGLIRAVAVNAGNANACNGPQGMQDALTTAAAVAAALDIPEEQVAVSSTGVIGQRLPVEKLLAGIPRAVAGLQPDGGHGAARAIMTTDLVSKEAAVQLQINGVTVTVGGMAKGSGMIHPNMATMLCYVTTDAAIGREALESALKEVVNESFNMITVDGDTSTNDTLLVLANGQAGNRTIEAASPEYSLFKEALTQVCQTLAKAIARDGEGATKLIEVKLQGALTLADARQAARAVAGSNLFKAAVFGRDANWGRAICAVGYSGADFDPDRVDIFLGDEQVARDGIALAFDETRAEQILSQDTVTITIDMKIGAADATAWGCDLTYDYVRINGSYRS